MNYLRSIFLISMISISYAHGVEEKPNCKLTIRTTFVEGNKSLKIEEVFTASKESCRLEARTRQKNQDEDIKNVRVSFSWRDPDFQF